MSLRNLQSCLLAIGLFHLASCKKEPATMTLPDNEKEIFLVVNHTGHNPPHRYCGNELRVTFFISSPREQIEVTVNGDLVRQIGIDIKPDELITVSAMDAQSQKFLAEASTSFTGKRITSSGDVNLPAVLLCPKDHLQFTYW